MLNLSLLPNNLKNELKTWEFYRFLEKIIIALLAIILSVVMIIFSAKLILKNYFRTVADYTNQATVKTQKYDDRIKQINSALEEINIIQNQSNYWPALIGEIAAITPGGLSLASLKMNSNDKTLTIVGKAKFREDLLQFKNDLEKIKYIKDVELPIQNILERQNANFNINAKLILPITND